MSRRRRTTRLIGAVGALVVAAGLATACAPDGGDRTSVTVYAAASLQRPFEEIARVFAEAHPDIDVQPLVTDGSNVLATQIREGARPDVVATADERTMERIADLVDGPEIFATNTLVVITPPGRAVSGIDALASPELRVVFCAEAVPCGAASKRLLDASGQVVTPVSEEQNVTAVLTKVETGVADAGIVYRTDAIGRDVEIVEAPRAADVVNSYPIGVLEDADEPTAAAAFVEFVTGPPGQSVLAEHGFGSP